MNHVVSKYHIVPMEQFQKLEIGDRLFNYHSATGEEFEWEVIVKLPNGVTLRALQDDADPLMFMHTTVTSMRTELADFWRRQVKACEETARRCQANRNALCAALNLPNTDLIAARDETASDYYRASAFLSQTGNGQWKSARKETVAEGVQALMEDLHRALELVRRLRPQDNTGTDAEAQQLLNRWKSGADEALSR